MKRWMKVVFILVFVFGMTACKQKNTYKVELAGNRRIENELKDAYEAGEKVTIQLGTITEHYYRLYVNGVEQKMDRDASGMMYTYYTFIMPSEHVTVKIEDCYVDIPDAPVQNQGTTSDTDAYVVKTYEATDPEDATETDKLVIFVTHYEMSDGTWKTANHTYKYRLEKTGRVHNAASDTTFVFLSNIENITFEQMWKAAGLSSNLNDYFDADVARFVGMK
ncbi:MAG: hypothetical protein IJ353_07985 [Lachnospiraceae bacterium]|nr:hypothetical protein [Lachnospiraceae bacterium]